MNNSIKDDNKISFSFVDSRDILFHDSSSNKLMRFQNDLRVRPNEFGRRDKCHMTYAAALKCSQISAEMSPKPVLL